VNFITFCRWNSSEANSGGHLRTMPGHMPVMQNTNIGKERKEVYLYSAIYCDTLNALRRGSHSFTCK